MLLMPMHSVFAEKLDLNNLDEARKFLIYEHGRENGMLLSPGSLTLSPGKDAAARIGISDAVVPKEPYVLKARLRFPEGVHGHAGFQVRRAAGKQCYVHVAPSGTYIGLLGAAPKLLEKYFEKASSDSILLVICVGEHTLDVQMNGVPCFSLDNLGGGIGGIAISAYRTDVTVSEISIAPLTASTFVPVSGALWSNDFSRPVEDKRYMRHHYGEPENFQITDGALKLAGKSHNCVILGGTEGMRDFSVQSRLCVGESGTGGFLVRRDCGKQIYVYLTAHNRMVGIDNTKAPLPSELHDQFVDMAIECSNGILRVSIDGKLYLEESELRAPEGAVAFANYGGEVMYATITVIDSTYCPPHEPL